MRRFGKRGRDGLKVAHRMLLSGHGRVVRHVEVFAPAGERGVGAAEPHVGELLLVDERHGGELRLTVGVEQAQAIFDRHVAKARAGCEREQVLLHEAWCEAGEHVGVALGAQQVDEAYGSFDGREEVVHDGAEPLERCAFAQRRCDTLDAHHAELGERS